MNGDELSIDENGPEKSVSVAPVGRGQSAFHWMKGPAIGLCGALVIAMAPGFIFEKPLFHVSVEAAIALLLIHSLWWQKTKHRGAMSLRAITAVTSMVHALAWTHVDGAIAGWVVSSAAVVVFAAYGIAWLVTGRWGALIVPAGAVVSFLAAPANFGIDKVQASPAGPLRWQLYPFGWEQGWR